MPRLRGASGREPFLEDQRRSTRRSANTRARRGFDANSRSGASPRPTAATSPAGRVARAARRRARTAEPTAARAAACSCRPGDRPRSAARRAEGRRSRGAGRHGGSPSSSNAALRIRARNHASLAASARRFGGATCRTWTGGGNGVRRVMDRHRRMVAASRQQVASRRRRDGGDCTRRTSRRRCALALVAPVEVRQRRRRSPDARRCRAKRRRAAVRWRVAVELAPARIARHRRRLDNVGSRARGERPSVKMVLAHPEGDAGITGGRWRGGRVERPGQGAAERPRAFGELLRRVGSSSRDVPDGAECAERTPSRGARRRAAVEVPRRGDMTDRRGRVPRSVRSAVGDADNAVSQARRRPRQRRRRRRPMWHRSRSRAAVRPGGAVQRRPVRRPRSRDARRRAAPRPTGRRDVRAAMQSHPPAFSVATTIPVSDRLAAGEFERRRRLQRERRRRPRGLGRPRAPGRCRRRSARTAVPPRHVGDARRRK